MKSKFLTVSKFMTLSLITFTLNAQLQVKDTIVIQQKEYVVVTEGKLTYLMSNNNSSLERPETKEQSLTGKTYEHVAFDFTPEHRKYVHQIIRSVFPEERIKELAGLTLFCSVKYSPVENKILHFRFTLRVQNSDSLRLKLSELFELEQKFRIDPKFVPFRDGMGEIRDGCEFLNYSIVFDQIYE